MATKLERLLKEYERTALRPAFPANEEEKREYERAKQGLAHWTWRLWKAGRIDASKITMKG